MLKINQTTKYFAYAFATVVMVASPVYGKDLAVHKWSCAQVEAKIDYLRDEQRKVNRPKRADRLNALIRSHRELERDCKAARFL